MGDFIINREEKEFRKKRSLTILLTTPPYFLEYTRYDSEEK